MHRTLSTICLLLVVSLIASSRLNAQDASDEKGQVVSPQSRLEAARRLLTAANDPLEREQRAGRLQECQLLVAAARSELDSSIQQDERSLREFPAFIPPEETDLRAKRQQVETRLMSSQLAHAQCYLLEGELYEPGDRRRRQFRLAFEEYEQLHKRYRSQVAGLYARLMQGKCCQETGDLRIALGIYEEILGHEGSSSSLVALKDRALQFRLECLNTVERKDFKLVEQEGSDWLLENSDRTNSSTGQAIRWELCKALAALGKDRQRTQAEREGFLKRALELSEELNHEGDVYKSGTRQLIDQIQQELNGAPPPDDKPTT